MDTQIIKKDYINIPNELKYKIALWVSDKSVITKLSKLSELWNIISLSINWNERNINLCDNIYERFYWGSESFGPENEPEKYTSKLNEKVNKISKVWNKIPITDKDLKYQQRLRGKYFIKKEKYNDKSNTNNNDKYSDKYSDKYREKDILIYSSDLLNKYINISNYNIIKFIENDPSIISKLTKLSISFSTLSYIQHENMLENYKITSNIEHLKLVNCNEYREYHNSRLKFTDITHKNYPKLKSLYINRIYISDLKCFNNLGILFLSHISDHGLTKIEKLPNLYKLTIRFCNYIDDINCQSIKELEVSACSKLNYLPTADFPNLERMIYNLLYIEDANINFIKKVKPDNNLYVQIDTDYYIKNGIDLPLPSYVLPNISDLKIGKITHPFILG